VWTVGAPTEWSLSKHELQTDRSAVQPTPFTRQHSGWHPPHWQSATHNATLSKGHKVTMLRSQSIRHHRNVPVRVFSVSVFQNADPGGRAVYGVGLRRFAWWDCGFESLRVMHFCLFWLLCCQVEVSASGWSLAQRSPTECGVAKSDREAGIMRRPWPTGAPLCRRDTKYIWQLSHTLNI
jgi:hypothetical protein